MKTMVARYPGTCSRTGASIKPGDVIVWMGKGKAYLDSPSTDIDVDLEATRFIDPDLADADPEAAAHAGRYLRQSIAKGVSDVWRTSTGKEYYRNRRGLCEDAPCCGCCNA